MKTYIIKSSYKYEIKADSKEEAMEKFQGSIEEDLASSNVSLLNEFMESLKAEELESEEKDRNNAEHPTRKKAIEIIEAIEGFVDKDEAFEGENYYKIEDAIVEILSS